MTEEPSAALLLGRIADDFTGATDVAFVAGVSLVAAADAIEEIEATARLYLLLRHETVRGLTPAQVRSLRTRAWC